MEKKESLKKESSRTSKISGLSNKSFSIIKFILGICLLPFIYSSSVSFLDQLSLIEKPLQTSFWLGVISLLITYLIIWEPVIVYARGQKLLEIIFSFFKPLVKIAPYLLPVYTIILFLIFWLVSIVLKSVDLTKHFVFLFGFSFVFHLIFSAKTMRSKQADFLKANYIFGFSLIFIINLTLIALFFNFIFNEFSFVGFINQSLQIARNIIYSLFKQLFL